MSRAATDDQEHYPERTLADVALISGSLSVPEQFAALFDRHAPAIHRYAARRLGPDAADDLVAETFLLAFARRAGYDTRYPDARPWLFGIATHLIARKRRAEVRFFRAIARTGADPAATSADLVADQVVDRVAAQAARRDLAAALAGLAAADRDVLLLVASGLGYAEIARALGVPAGTVSSRLARARRKVRQALGGVNPVATEEGSGDE
jgi:RNA polymerase sigma-70 factor (ECF subfamily)